MQTQRLQEIVYQEAGEGLPVILTHGIGASRRDWEALSARLVRGGSKVYALDLPGHGDSQKPPERAAYRAEAVYRAFSAWLEGLDLDRPPALVGHSLGGYLSLRYACDHPDRVRRLALIDPFYSPEQLHPLLRLARRRAAWGEPAVRLTPLAWMNLAGDLVLGRDKTLSPTSRRQMIADLKRASPQILRIAQSLDDLTPRLPRVNCPVLVVWGERDPLLRPGSFLKLAARLPDADTLSLPGARHYPHRTHFERVWGALSAFLNSD
jgi:pimeloyl-ACP methyl ester carboxylesterase